MKNFKAILLVAVTLAIFSCTPEAIERDEQQTEKICSTNPTTGVTTCLPPDDNGEG